MRKLLLLNGPNLNLLGNRKTDTYGTKSLQNIEEELVELVATMGFELDTHQSNHEGELIDWLHKANETYLGVVFNPGAYTHTSIAIRDAIEAIKVPVIETHISNIHNRESFRNHSYISPAAAGLVVGFGPLSYKIGVYALIEKLNEREREDGEN
ncbi:type II 3-dehydroquinate dehydratase [Alkalibacillus aidingensis]|uniref:type II 3-dehydroquinate dehydratase n=1 Tax=Alkalibacillus aidingensis TaxID=2747607 RepID=UPI0016600DE9|nr:type II 3-dehydroquinate dehydratase [Alkalibacillus aidingensis]